MLRSSKNRNQSNEQMPFVDKRVSNRIPVNIDARFFHGNIFYSGIVRNLSDQGMFIDTKKCLPFDSMFVVIIREENDLLKVIAKVKRASINTDTCLGMGVELLSPSAGYLDFIHRLHD
jgi:hypothetical protein